VRAILMVINDVLSEESKQLTLAENHDVIENFSAY
jgi:hypothetical protein